MANGRNPGRTKRDTSRDAGGFVALPWVVLDSPAYAGLSYVAKSLLVEVARQLVRDNNGTLLLSRRHLETRGWYSSSAIDKAKTELLEANLIFEMVKGQRPNKASWYAVGWYALTPNVAYDIGKTLLFKRSAYLYTPAKAKRESPKCKNPSKAERQSQLSVGSSGPERKIVSPAAGATGASIVPATGTVSIPSVPVAGAIKAILPTMSAPATGHHLDKPSPNTRRAFIALRPHN